MRPLHVNSDTSSTCGGADDTHAVKDGKLPVGTGIENIIARNEVEDDTVEEEEKDPKNSNDEGIKFCDQNVPSDVSGVIKRFPEVTLRRSGNERINAHEEINDSTDKFCESKRPYEIPSEVSSTIQVKDSSIKTGNLDNVNIQPNNLSSSKFCIHSVSLEVTDLAKIQVHSKPIQYESIENKGQNKSKNGSENDKDPNIVSEDYCQLIGNVNQVDNQKTHIKTCDGSSLKSSDIEPNNNVQHCDGKGNGVRHPSSQYNNVSTPRNNDSISTTESKVEIIKDTSDECSVGGQQKSLDCKNYEPSNLEESNFVNTIFSQKVNDKMGNDTPTNFASGDVSFDIVIKDCVEHDGLQNVCNSDVDRENLEIELTAENVHSKITKLSVRESGVEDISDSKVNVSTDTLIEVSQGTMHLASEETEEKLNNCTVSTKCVRKSIEGSPIITDQRALFLRGSFPRIALRDTGGMTSIKRLQRQILKERERRENLVNECDSKKSPVKEKTPMKKKKVSVGKAVNSKLRVGSCKKTVNQNSTNYPNLKRLQVCLEKMDEKLLSKYNVKLPNLHVRAVVNKTSNGSLRSLKSVPSHFRKNKITHFEHSANCDLLKGNNIGSVKKVKVPAKEDNSSMRKQMQIKSCEAKLKHASVHILKIDESILLKYGYNSQKLKTSSVARTTHCKNRKLPVVKSIIDEDNLGKKKTNHILNINHVKYPPQILLSRIDAMYPNIVKQTLKLNTYKNTKNRVLVKGKTKAPKTIVIDQHDDLKTAQISVTKISNAALSKCGRKKCHNRKMVPKNGANVCVAKNRADIHPIDTVPSQERLFSKKQAVFEQRDICENTVNASRISQKRKADSFNRVLINDYSKENVCLNGESWHLKHARVSLMKLDNSVLPKVFSPSVIKIKSK